MDKSDEDADGGQSTKAALTSMPYQCQELILSIVVQRAIIYFVYLNHKDSWSSDFIGFWNGALLDSATLVRRNFMRHDLSFSLRTGTDPDVTIRLRRRFNVDSFTSHQCSFDILEYTQYVECCAKTFASAGIRTQISLFPGLRMDYEYIAKGTVWTNGKMKVVISQIQRTEKAGHYDQSNLRDFLTLTWWKSVYVCLILLNILPPLSSYGILPISYFLS
ncbi:Mediator of RNA polymerase II transcription subunit 18 [Parelaphostrongylus tenuis]|uniref:Mediator of RNA polymerase II transcription subunit 18 n=1 Tax=Parelaphostrongylus tenuis TaxID=148309 RepID=A0AAD5QIV9_PARTN|nr:Mediator of RNA polymerase II transcription subunit 18 [Parelaphostrongylus tenuis]